MRGQFYSVIAVLIAIPVFVFTVQYLSYGQRTGQTIADRVISDQMSQLVQSIELDTEKAMEVSGRRALLEATNYVVNSGEYLDDSVGNLTILMLSGVINGSESFLMINNTMPNWSERISSKPVSFNVNLSYGNVSIENYDGFSVRIGMDINITVTDKLGRARIEKDDVRRYVTISLEGLEDPFFPLNTQGFIRRTIRRAPQDYTAFNLVSVSTYAEGNCSGQVTFNKSEVDTSKILVADNLSGVVYARHGGIILGDSDNLTGQIGCYVAGNSSAVSLVSSFIEETEYDTVHIDPESKSAWSLPLAEYMPGGYYYEGSGPDFLKRLEGDYSPSADGLVTFIYVPELEGQAFPVESDTRVAYRYFNGGGSCHQVRGLPAWFGMDSTDAAGFNLTALLTTDSCEDSSF